MAKALKTIAIVAGAVALVATGIGAAAGAGLIGTTAAGAASATVLGVSAGTFTAIGAIAGVASAVASLGAQMMAKPPPARGAVNQVMITPNAPAPYVIGRTFFPGVLRYDRGYGATLNKVPNPYRALALVLSVAGPVQAVEATTFDYQTVPFSASAATGYYSTFLYRDVRLGQSPETALTPYWAGAPNWSASHKLSSKCAVMLSMLFDKDGKRYASGVPAIGHVVQGVRAYDPRKDSTYPGGSGSHRINNEATWEYTENPGLHGLTYALGRYRVGKKVFGIGLPPEGIRIGDFVRHANICDANGWKVGGVIFEPGDRWANLKDILIAGGATPGFPGGKLGLKINAPGVSLYTIRREDLADEDAEITAMQTGQSRLNGIIPKYRSEAHKWEYVASDLVSVPSYVTEDGEEKKEERQYNLVQSKDQAAQLAAYDLVNGREMAPITVTCKPHLRKFGVGDMLTLDLPEDHGLAMQKVVIIDRQLDPGTMKVTLTFASETDAKHAFALGRTGTAPPTPALTSPQDRDTISAEVGFGTPGAPGADGLIYGNLVRYSRMEQDKRGWAALYAGPGTSITSTDAGEWQGSRFFRGHFAATGAGQTISIGQAIPDYQISVLGMERLAVQLGVEGAGALSTIEPSLWFRDAAGGLITRASLALLPGNSPYNTPVRTFVAVPPGAATAFLEVYGITSSAGSAALDLTMPMITVAHPEQTEFPAFVPGPVDGDDGYALSPASWALAVNCSAGGAIKPGQLPAQITMSAAMGPTDISTDANIAFAISSPSGLAASLSGTNNRVLTISNLTADTGALTITATHGGATIGHIRVNVTRVLDGSAGMIAADTSIAINNFASYAGVQGGPLTLAAGPGGSIKLTALVNYWASAGAGKLAGKFQYRTTPGAGGWTDVAAEEQDPSGASVGEPSALSMWTTMAGPVGAENWEFQLLLRKYSGTGTLAVSAGNFRVERV